MSERPFCIGLTGGIGSGKSTVANIFANLGVAVIDTDQIARKLTQPNGAAIGAIRVEFGEHLIDAVGALDRSGMRDLVFSDADARKRLEAILHPMIRNEAERQLMAAAACPYALLVVPLLVETGSYRELIDRVLVVDCDEDQQMQRAMERDGLSEAQVRAIQAAQASRQVRLAAADDVIENAGDLDSLQAAVEAAHRNYQIMARKAR